MDIWILCTFVPHKFQENCEWLRLSRGRNMNISASVSQGRAWQSELSETSKLLKTWHPFVSHNSVKLSVELLKPLRLSQCRRDKIQHIMLSPCKLNAQNELQQKVYFGMGHDTLQYGAFVVQIADSNLFVLSCDKVFSFNF